MSKEFFRFLRGEINGYYLTRLNNLLNLASQDIKDFLSNFKHMQFDLKSMPPDVAYGLGAFAGVHLANLSTETGYGILRFTESNKVNGQERSERGLLSRETEGFDFVHTEQDDYPSDINLLSTDDLKSSMVGDESVEGYIASSSTPDDVLDNNGNVKPSAVLPSPPLDEAYTDFYGNNFLYLWDGTFRVTPISYAMFFELFKVMQYIRYNGVNIKSFVQMVETICPCGFVTIVSIEKNLETVSFTVTYRVNEVVVTSQQQRLELLNYLVTMKFPQFVMVMEE